MGRLAARGLARVLVLGLLRAAPMRFSVSLDGRAIDVEGHDAATMAAELLDAMPPSFSGEGCVAGDRECARSFLTEAIDVANRGAAAAADFSLELGNDPAGPLLILCASLGTTMGDEGAVAGRLMMEFEFRKFANKTFGDAASRGAGNRTVVAARA